MVKRRKKFETIDNEEAEHTRFEIPFELSNVSESVKPLNQCLGSPRSKQPKCDADDNDEAGKLATIEPTTPNEGDTIRLKIFNKLALPILMHRPTPKLLQATLISLNKIIIKGNFIFKEQLPSVV